jgi:transposase/AraC-like DNA-binding protein
MAINTCPQCLEKQQKIDKMTEEIQRLRQENCRLKRKIKEGPFGSSTPSAKKPLKANTSQPLPASHGPERRKRGAQAGHPGHGRKGFDEAEADEVIELANDVERCPDCGEPLRDKGFEEKSVLDIPPQATRKIRYRMHKKYCPHCRKTFTPAPASVLPDNLYSNRLIAVSATMHYLHGIPMGRVCNMLGLNEGTLAGCFRRIAERLDSCLPRLYEMLRQAPVKHADETGWRTQGKNGYCWSFLTPELAVFLFRNTRASAVPLEVFGNGILFGVLVADRYAGYNVLRILKQYCYAHLLRAVTDLLKEFPDNTEVKAFVDRFAPLLARAMKLRSLPIPDEEYYSRAEEIKQDILQTVAAPANHMGIRKIQEIFRENEPSLYQWVKDRRVPADNNAAERGLRPTVIARKVSFGSQSHAGAKMRGVWMSVIRTIQNQGLDPATHLKNVLDALTRDPRGDPFDLLFPNFAESLQGARAVNDG